MSDYAIQCSTCGAPDMMLCECRFPGGAPPAPLDEARMREILKVAAVDAGYSIIGLDALFGSRQLEIVLAAMSRAISEARAEQRERDVALLKECRRFVQYAFEGSKFGSHLENEANGILTMIDAAIRSQDNPDKQVER